MSRPNGAMMNLSEAVANFLLASEADGLRLKTLIWYRSILRRYADKSDPACLLSSITPNDIRKYIVGLKEFYKPESVSGHTRALHRFWKWGAIEYNITNPMKNIKYPKAPQARSPESFTAEELEKLLRIAGEGTNGARDKAILAFMLDTGARAAGVVNLKWKDIDLEQGVACVCEKGADERNVYFSHWTAELIYQWRAVARRDPYVFCNVRNGGAMKPNGLYLLFRRLDERANMGVGVFPHKMRHTMARHWRGGITSLQQQMGHSDPKTTIKFYGRFLDRDLGKMYEEMSPSAILRRRETK